MFSRPGVYSLVTAQVLPSFRAKLWSLPMAGMLIDSTTVPDSSHRISESPALDSLNGAWKFSPAWFCRRPDAYTIKYSPGAIFVSAGKVNAVARDSLSVSVQPEISTVLRPLLPISTQSG